MSNMSQKPVDLTPNPLTAISGHDDNIWEIVYFPEGARLVTCSPDRTVRVWNVENGEQEGTSMEHGGWVHALAVTGDGKRILSGGADKRITVWDSETHEPIEEWGGSHRQCPVGDAKGRIVVRETKEGGQVKYLIETGIPVYSVRFSPNGGNSLAPGGIHDIYICEVDNGGLLVGPIAGHEGWVRCVLWSLDGSQLFSASDDRTIRRWDSETGGSIGQPWMGHTDYVTCLSLSPDGTKLASASLDGTVRFWDAETGDSIGQLLRHEHYVWTVAFSPSGEFVASGGEDEKVSIWRVPWWNDIEKQQHDSLLDLPAIHLPKNLPNNQVQNQLDFLDHFWRGLVAPHSSSPDQRTIEPQPIQARRFWRPLVFIPVIKVAAGQLSDRVKAGRTTIPKKNNKKRDDKAHKQQKLRTQAEASTRNIGPFNSQTGHPASSSTLTQGRFSSFARSTVSDNWDDMDRDEKCVGFVCFGPRENRKRLRPWREKAPAMKAGERVKKEKKQGSGARHPKSSAPQTQTPVRPSHHQDPLCDYTKTTSLASPACNEANLRRVNLQLQEQVEQLRRQLDDVISAKRMADAEKDLLEKEVRELRFDSHETPEAQDHPSRMHSAVTDNTGVFFTQHGSLVAGTGPSSSLVKPSGSTSCTGPSASDEKRGSKVGEQSTRRWYSN
ncbi:WD40 repeat-like protein [Paxillus ammoniavirescens]|nr:WD40 repeat-like protein [Paxillus ammoniavirescens]